MIIPKFGYSKIIRALYKLCLYNDKNNNEDIKWISYINQYKRVMSI